MDREARGVQVGKGVHLRTVTEEDLADPFPFITGAHALGLIERAEVILVEAIDHAVHARARLGLEVAFAGAIRAALVEA